MAPLARRPPPLRCRYDLAFVESGPLPPHERSWRHPSEIAAEERRVVQTESGSGSVRAIALAGGTLGLLAIGLTVLTLTPDRLDAPVQLATPETLDRPASSATSLSALRAAPTPTTGALAAPGTEPAVAPTSTAPTSTAAPSAPTTDLVRPSLTTFTTVARALPAATTTSSPPVSGPDADPIGSTGYALVATESGVADGLERHAPVEVKMPAGDLRTALTVASTDVVALVAVDPAAGSRLANHVPAPADTVFVSSDHDTIETTYAELVAVGEPPAVAVVTDADGAVVGVCADHEGKLVYLPLVGPVRHDATGDDTDADTDDPDHAVGDRGDDTTDRRDVGDDVNGDDTGGYDVSGDGDGRRGERWRPGS